MGEETEPTSHPGRRLDDPMAGLWAQAVGLSQLCILAKLISLVLLAVHSPTLPGSGRGLGNCLTTTVPKSSTPLFTDCPLILP